MKKITFEEYREALQFIKDYGKRCNPKEQAHYGAQQEYLNTKSKYYFDKDRNR